MLFQICAPASLLQHPAHRQTHTREHSSGMTSVFSLCTKQGTNCTVDCFTVKRSWIRHLLSLPSWYGFKVDLPKVCGCVCVSMPVTLCSLYAGALLFLHLIHSLRLHVYLPVCAQAFLNSSGYDPCGSHQCHTNLTCFEPAVPVCTNGLLRLSTWQQLETTV